MTSEITRRVTAKDRGELAYGRFRCLSSRITSGTRFLCAPPSELTPTTCTSESTARRATSAGVCNVHTISLQAHVWLSRWNTNDYVLYEITTKHMPRGGRVEGCHMRILKCCEIDIKYRPGQEKLQRGRGEIRQRGGRGQHRIQSRRIQMLSLCSHGHARLVPP